ncbi:hypothetical protein CONCODRAFT_76543 [Conidiobolus coronatus NRRL 28638]|uniref:Xylanolytic transcriptional activator regulatory domain-containing protein n=1 Tax=Conidiobolus coronatus (strain ATCC 28846 / CBS 209.66 / NRRL 28638) TaxID=796925 RepID=A0A137PJ53_CONC2|nr:hypothetical protein CONCODRAFT_76543 [Conidiobolus coronatus NRRL 28638]|eukprot:KXN75027.1 hypothetical protein CONCODRAFT_76543 [Conidiobolus coronatus NRRL 28638]
MSSNSNLESLNNDNKRKRQKKTDTDSEEPPVKIDRRKTRPIHPRITGVDKLKSRLSSLEDILNTSVPQILKLLDKVNNGSFVSSSETEGTVVNTNSSVANSDTDFSDATDIDTLLQLLSPPQKFRFGEHDFTHHLLNLYFTIDEYTGQQPIVTRLEFFNNPLTNPFPKLLTYAMLSSSSRYSNHAQIQYHNTEYSDHYIKAVNSELMAESFSPSVTTVQGLLVLCSVELVKGNLYNVWKWLSHAIRIAQQLNFHELNNSDIDYFQFYSPEDKSKFQRLWNILQLFELEMSRLLSKPTMIKEFSISQSASQINSPTITFHQDDYIARCMQTIPIYARNILQYMKELVQFQNEAEHLGESISFNSDPEWIIKQYYNHYSKLNSWYHKLPSTLAYRKEFQSEILQKKFPFLEQVINGHLVYNRTQLTLLKPILENFNKFKTSAKAYEMVLKGIEISELVCTYLNDWLMVKESTDNFESALDQFELENFPFIEEEPDSQNSFSMYSSSPSFPSYPAFRQRPQPPAQPASKSTVPFVSSYILAPGLNYILSLKLNQLLLMENLVETKFQYFLNCIKLVETEWEGSLACYNQLMRLYSELNSVMQ